MDSLYEYPYSIYQKYFPNGNEEEFDEAFVTFDVSEEEFNDLTQGNERYICLETVVFDKSFIKTPINNNLEIKNTFRK